MEPEPIRIRIIETRTTVVELGPEAVAKALPGVPIFTDSGKKNIVVFSALKDEAWDRYEAAKAMGVLSDMGVDSQVDFLENRSLVHQHADMLLKAERGEFNDS